MSSRICSSTYDFSIQSIGPIPLVCISFAIFFLYQSNSLSFIASKKWDRSETFVLCFFPLSVRFSVLFIRLQSQKSVPWEYEATQLNIHFTNNREIVLSILSYGGEDVSEEMQQSSLVDRHLESSHPVVLSLCWLCGDLLPSWLDEPSVSAHFSLLFLLQSRDISTSVPELLQLWSRCNRNELHGAESCVF